MSNFLKETNGQSSSTRLIFFIGSLWIMGLCTFVAINGATVGEVMALYGAIMGVLTGLKLGQKTMEK